MRALSARAELYSEVRAFFSERGLAEVETPLLGQATIPSPMIESLTTSFRGPGHAGGIEMYLQTSPEFAMKRLLAAGSGAIFQICKAFRDGEAGRFHNPEFTILEWYRPDFDHHALMDEMESFLELILGTGPCERIPYSALFRRVLDLDPHTATIADLAATADRHDLQPPATLAGRDEWLAFLLTHLIEPELARKDPVFVFDYPATQAALARVRPGPVALASRFEVYFRGVELANGFHELKDAGEQRNRFRAELAERQELGMAPVPVDPVGRDPAGEREPGAGADQDAEATPFIGEFQSKSVMLSIDPDGDFCTRLNELADEPALPELKQGAEKYRILEELGSGGMGKVYLAYDQDLERAVALKTVQRTTPELVRRFVEEAKIMGQLQHPNIVTVHELGLTAQNKLYYTMPVVTGRTLSDVLEKLQVGDVATQHVYSLTRLMQVFTQITQALSYAHAKGVVHRDLKPVNVMLGAHGEVQVLDWGISKVLGHAWSSATGRLMGTPGYMAPEQTLGDEVDARTDIFALGAMLYEFLTLTRPFGYGMEALRRAVHEAPEPPRQRAPERSIPQELERICLRAMSKAPVDRYQAADTLAVDVQAWIEAEADSQKRRQLADDKARTAQKKLQRYLGLKAELVDLERHVSDVRERFKPWDSSETKRPLYDAEDAVRGAHKKLQRIGSETVETLIAALGFDPEHSRSRELLADHYWQRFLEADADADDDRRGYLEELVSAYHDGIRDPPPARSDRRRRRP